MDDDPLKRSPADSHFSTSTMKFTSVILSVVMACGLVTAAPSEASALVTQTEQSAYGTPVLHKIVTYYDKENYTGQNYTLFDNRLHYCVNFTRGPLVVKSAMLFANTVCDLYTEQGCGYDAYKLTITKDTPDTGLIDLFGMHCTTV